MTPVDRCLLLLCRAGALGETPSDLPDDAELFDVLALASQYKMGALVADALLRVPNLPDFVRVKALRALDRARYLEAVQYYEISTLEASFAEHRVDFCLLKGAHWRACYPTSYLREMKDVDLLVRLDQWKSACAVIEEQGFERATHQEIELHAAFYKNDVELELHRHLLSFSHGRRVPVFRDIWDRIKPDSAPYRWTLTPTDEYFYFFIHMEMHIGMVKFTPRMFADAYILRRFGQPIDRALLMRCAQRSGLLGFIANIEAISEGIMTGAPLSEAHAAMLDYLMNLSRMTYDEREYSIARRWVRRNYTPIGMIRQFFSSKPFLLSRFDGVSVYKAELKWLVSALHRYHFYTKKYLIGIWTLPRERRRRLNAELDSLYRLEEGREARL